MTDHGSAAPGTPRLSSATYMVEMEVSHDCFSSLQRDGRGRDRTGGAEPVAAGIGAAERPGVATRSRSAPGAWRGRGPAAARAAGGAQAGRQAGVGASLRAAGAAVLVRSSA